jgi:hypothetical protein
MFPLFVFSFVMLGSESEPLRQLNSDSYPLMAFCAAIAAILTTLLTRKEIPHLRQPAGEQDKFHPSLVLKEMGRALGNKQFSLIFVIVLISSAIGGVLVNIDIYMTTFFLGIWY